MASQNTPGTTRIPQDPSERIRLGAQVTAEPGGCLPLYFILDETALPAIDQSTAGMVFGENVEPLPGSCTSTASYTGCAVSPTAHTAGRRSEPKDPTAPPTGKT